MIGVQKNKFEKINLATMIISWIMWIPFGNAINVYWQIYLDEIGTPTYAIALLFAVSTITIAFSRLIGGYLADKNGRKTLISLLTYLVGGTYLLLALTTDWTIIILISILTNIFLLYQPAISALLADSMPEEKRGKSYALTMIIPNISALLAPPIAYYFVLSYGLINGMRYMLIAMWFDATIVASIRLILLRETIKPQRKIGSFWNEYKIITKELLNNMRAIISFSIFVNLALGLIVMLQLYAINELNISFEVWSIILELYIIVYIISAYPIGHIADKVGRKPLLKISVVIYSISTVILVTFSLSAPLTALLIFHALTAFGASILGTALPAIQTDYINKEKRGKGFAVLALINSLSMAFGQILGGIFYQLNPQLPLVISSLIWLIAYHEARNIRDRSIINKIVFTESPDAAKLEPIKPVKVRKTNKNALSIPSNDTT